MRKFLVYDVEVLRGPDQVEGGWRNPEAMGFGTAVVYSADANCYYFFGPGQENDLATTLAESIVVSFNGVQFDNRVVLGNDYKQRPEYPRWFDIDLLLVAIASKFRCKTMEEAYGMLGQRRVHDGTLNLGAICSKTISMDKTGHGAHAPQLIAEEKWADVYAYNLHDVRMTLRLYEFIQGQGFFRDGNGDRFNVGDIALEINDILKTRR